MVSIPVSFLLTAGEFLFIDILLFVYLVSWHLGCYQFVATKNQAAGNVCIQGFV